MISAMQMRMARAALDWTVRELEARSGVGRNTISRFEAGSDILASALDALQKTFDAAGVIFFSCDIQHGSGVGLREKTRTGAKRGTRLVRRRPQ